MRIIMMPKRRGILSNPVSIVFLSGAIGCFLLKPFASIRVIRGPLSSLIVCVLCAFAALRCCSHDRSQSTLLAAGLLRSARYFVRGAGKKIRRADGPHRMRKNESAGSDLRLAPDWNGEKPGRRARWHGGENR